MVQELGCCRHAGAGRHPVAAAHEITIGQKPCTLSPDRAFPSLDAGLRRHDTLERQAKPCCLRKASSSLGASLPPISRST